MHLRRFLLQRLRQRNANQARFLTRLTSSAWNANLDFTPTQRASRRAFLARITTFVQIIARAILCRVSQVRAVWLVQPHATRANQVLLVLAMEMRPHHVLLGQLRRKRVVNVIRVLLVNTLVQKQPSARIVHLDMHVPSQALSGLQENAKLAFMHKSDQ